MPPRPMVLGKDQTPREKAKKPQSKGPQSSAPKPPNKVQAPHPTPPKARSGSDKPERSIAPKRPRFSGSQLWLFCHPNRPSPPRIYPHHQPPNPQAPPKSRMSPSAQQNVQPQVRHGGCHNSAPSHRATFDSHAL